MKKIQKHSYEDLKGHADMLAELLDFPHPELKDWVKACAEQVKAIGEYQKHFKEKK